jgi:hypothetical protein
MVDVESRNIKLHMKRRNTRRTRKKGNVKFETLKFKEIS